MRKVILSDVHASPHVTDELYIYISLDLARDWVHSFASEGQDSKLDPTRYYKTILRCVA